MGLGRTRRYNARSGRGVLNSSGHGVRPASSAATFLPARRQRLGRAGVSRRALLTELNHGNSITSVVRLPSPGSRLRGEHRAPHDLSLATPLPRRGSRLRRQLGQFSRAGAGQFSRAPKCSAKRRGVAGRVGDTEPSSLGIGWPPRGFDSGASLVYWRPSAGFKHPWQNKIVPATNLVDRIRDTERLTKDSSHARCPLLPAKASLVRHCAKNGSNVDPWLASALSSL